jgi:hypothetical protein
MIRGCFDGFDYVHQKPVTFKAREWRRLLGECLAAGGRRRHEAGETFFHAPGGRITHEVYGNVNVNP